MLSYLADIGLRSLIRVTEFMQVSFVINEIRINPISSQNRTNNTKSGCALPFLQILSLLYTSYASPLSA